MVDFTYPNNASLKLIAQDLVARLAADRLGFQLIPFQDVNASTLMWEQKDSFKGLQAIRGINGAPGKISKTGVDRYMTQPGHYGEYEEMDERELEEMRVLGDFGAPADISQLVVNAQQKLVLREADRQELTIFDLLLNGTFSIVGQSGAIVHTDTYTPQTFTASVNWSLPLTSTPLADIRACKILHRGHSVRFDATSKIVLNQTTMNQVLSNTNPADLFGRRGQGLATLNSLKQVNEILAMDDLPNFVVYDEVYLAEDSTVASPDPQLFVPTGKAVLVGRRMDGAPVGYYALTRNVNNPNNAPGPYSRIIDKGEFEIPRSIQVHRGHNGAIALEYPSAIVSMSVS